MDVNCFFSLFSEAVLAVSSFLGLMWSASSSFLPSFPIEPSNTQELILHYNFLLNTLSVRPDVQYVILAWLLSEQDFSGHR